ncbi:hypothetical protein ACFL1X_12915 [Candidatus Hydrogenedentota bacterium]
MTKKRVAKDSSSQSSEITDFVMQHPLFGAHSHMQPVEDWARTPAHFSSIEDYARADLVTAAGPMGIGETHLPSKDAKDFTKRFFEL